MARWDRDPKARVRVTWLLVAAEVLALSGNAYTVFSAYVNRLDVALHRSLGGTVPLIVVIVLTVLCLAGAVYVGIQYAHGKAWSRRTLIAANGSFFLMGLAWFVKNRLGNDLSSSATIFGLLLPIITLFPLLWPLITFRPFGAPPPPQGRSA